MLGKSVRPVAPATSPVFEITICDLKRELAWECATRLSFKHC